MRGGVDREGEECGIGIQRDDEGAMASGNSWFRRTKAAIPQLSNSANRQLAIHDSSKLCSRKSAVRNGRHSGRVRAVNGKTGKTGVGRWNPRTRGIRAAGSLAT